MVSSWEGTREELGGCCKILRRVGAKAVEVAVRFERDGFENCWELEDCLDVF